MSTPEDFPDLDLEAWILALPFPQADSPTPNLDRICHEVLTTKPLPVLSPVEARGIRRRKEKP